jgi:antitoxin (DNA-binding transcriptional repressor) of toxin-antitoxin stability system
MLRTVGIRALKDKLSAHLRDVQRGDVLLVSDRGRIIAELRPPTVQVPSADTTEARRQRLIDAGLLRPASRPNTPELYQRVERPQVPSTLIDQALEWTREDRA